MFPCVDIWKTVSQGYVISFVQPLLNPALQPLIISLYVGLFGINHLKSIP